MQSHYKKGISIVEGVIYFSILLLFALIIVEVLLQFSLTYRKLTVARLLMTSSQVSLDRIGRELRTATSVDTVASTLGTSPGQLKLNTTNDAGYTQTVKFTLEDGVVNVYENDILSGRLTSIKARTTNLVFRLINTGKSQAVRVEMTLEAGTTTSLRSEKFYQTVELRNSI